MSDESVSKRLIGSQRNPDAFKPKPSIDVVDSTPKPQTESYPPEPREQGPMVSESSVPESPVSEPISRVQPPALTDLDDEQPDRLSEDGEKALRNVPTRNTQRVQIPSVRGKLSDDLEDEFNALFAGQSVDSLIANIDVVADKAVIEPDTKQKAKVMKVQGDSVFLDLGAREQGVVSLKMFPVDAEPTPGQSIDVTVLRFLADEGLYDVSVPLAAADVRDWSQVQEGMIVEAKITKTNNGGLECEVNRLRGFIPISQIELFRVESLEPYVGQKLTCVVEEVNAERRNLVLSRRSMLQRERDELREKVWAELEVGQVREGMIRKIIDAGAFVDLGGVDGFIPIGAISWGRIKHPGDVLTEGTRVSVRISKIDQEANRISLIYRDEASNPWSNIFERFQEKTVARGKVSKIMDFGAFVELMPGVEGLIHISELSRKRVGNVHEVLKEGEWIDVYILSIDAAAKRLSLSLKELAPELPPEPVAEPESETSPETGKKGKGKKEAVEPVAAPVKFKNISKGPLKGGAGESSGGEQFGLKW